MFGIRVGRRPSRRLTDWRRSHTLDRPTLGCTSPAILARPVATPCTNMWTFPFFLLSISLVISLSHLFDLCFLLRWYARFRRGSWPLKDGGRLGAVLTPGRATTAACGRSASGSALIERWPWPRTSRYARSAGRVSSFLRRRCAPAKVAWPTQGGWHIAGRSAVGPSDGAFDGGATAEPAAPSSPRVAIDSRHLQC